MPKIVFLWTDVALFALLISAVIYGWRVSKSVNSRATWARVLQQAPAMCSAVVLSFFVLVGILDSIHLQLRLQTSESISTSASTTTASSASTSTSTSGAQSVVYSPEVVSLLDVLLADTALLHKEKTYSAPLAWRQFTKESILQEGGQTHRDFPRLKFGGRHLDDPETQWLNDVLVRGSLGLAAGVAIGLGLMGWLVWMLMRAQRKRNPNESARITYSDVWHDVWKGVYKTPWRAMLITVFLMAMIIGVTFGLASGYHVLGSDRTGNDVLWQALKSIRTAWVIGSLTTVAMLPVAILFGVTAGYFKGWVDDVIQYIYTTLTSIPGVLLIAACVLMMQVYIDTHADLFPTSAQRADLRLFLLCMILGLTGWAGLCRLLRAEVLKLRELEYVQAAKAFGVSNLRIMLRHLLPNLMHIILITLVLEFSGLVLYEAVLSYLGIGVDPTMNSFGTMIDKSRLEMSRDPMIWWTLLSAFVFMLTMVLAANLFADGVRDAFDPRSRVLRPRRFRRRAATQSVEKTL
ncbi:ABC transporter permease [Orrella sp. 11846]|uniref:ABC transporter permease n=1 Tax=Orrella sp. 11846 TaxID=3409913 RepID=UPI003B59F70F